MHLSALAMMKRCVDTYLTEDKEYQILDFGSFINKTQRLHHRLILQDIRCNITGVDIGPGRNVDLTMPQPYTIPVPSGSQDVVMSGQAFEHIPFPFASILEVARVLKPGGYLFITAPSRGRPHFMYDLWRYYPDSMRAFAKYAELELLEASTAWPQHLAEESDVATIPRAEYWGDTLGVFRKPHWRPSARRALHRWLTRRWANHLGDIDDVPRPGDGPTPEQRAADRAELKNFLQETFPEPAEEAAAPAATDSVQPTKRRIGLRSLVGVVLKWVVGAERTKAIGHFEKRLRRKAIDRIDAKASYERIRW